MKNLDAKESELVTVFKEVFKQIGWGDEDIRLIEQAAIAFEPNISVAVAFQIPINMHDLRTTNKPFMNYFRNLLDKARSSNLVRDELALVEDKLKMANTEIDYLRTEIAKLAKYETHYKLEMALRHGEQK